MQFLYRYLVGNSTELVREDPHDQKLNTQILRIQDAKGKSNEIISLNLMEI